VRVQSCVSLFQTDLVLIENKSRELRYEEFTVHQDVVLQSSKLQLEFCQPGRSESCLGSASYAIVKFKHCMLRFDSTGPNSTEEAVALTLFLAR
jgi:hypothetical protein